MFTNNDEYAEKIKMMRVHGQKKRYHHKYIGMGGRLDTIQAAILLAKLPYYSQELEGRHQVATRYNEAFLDKIKIPLIKTHRTSAWAQYTLTLNRRDDIQCKLKEIGIPSIVYYPKALSQQDGYKHYPRVSSGLLNSELLPSEVLSLPMFPYLQSDKQDRIIQSLIDLT